MQNDVNTNQDVCITKMSEQIRQIQEKLEEIPTRAEMILNIKEGVSDALKECDRKYATMERLQPIEKIVYGLVGFLLFAILGAIVELIIRK